MFLGSLGVSLNKLGIITEENKETEERKRNSIGIMQNIRRFPLRRSTLERLRVFAEARTLAKEALIYESNPVDEPRQRRHRGAISTRTPEQVFDREVSRRHVFARKRSRLAGRHTSRNRVRIESESRGGRAWTAQSTRKVRQRLSVTRAQSRSPIDNDDSETRGKERGASHSA